MSDIEVRPISAMDFSGSAEEKRVALALTDSSGETRAYVIDPQTLRALLPSMISLAATWSDEPDVSLDAIGGNQNALVAKKVLFARGRDDSEAGVRMFMGKNLDLTFLIPLAQLIPAFQLFAKNISVVKPPAGPTN